MADSAPQLARRKSGIEVAKEFHPESLLIEASEHIQDALTDTVKYGGLSPRSRRASAIERNKNDATTCTEVNKATAVPGVGRDLVAGLTHRFPSIDFDTVLDADSDMPSVRCSRPQSRAKTVQGFRRALNSDTVVRNQVDLKSRLRAMERGGF